MPKREVIPDDVLKKCIDEYVNGSQHMTDLAVKYGVKYLPLRRAMINAGASDLAKRNAAVSSAEVEAAMRERRERLNELCDALIERIETYAADDEYLKRNLRQLTNSLKDVKSVQGIVTDLDLREQEARIKNLEKAFESDGAGVVIKIEGGADAWSE